MATQDAFDFGDVEDANAEGIKKAAAKKAEKEAAQQEAKEKAKKAEADYFKDQRTPKSKLIAQSELNKMKAITGGQSSMISPSGNTTAAGRGTAYGGADLEMGMKGSRMPKPKLKAGGKVSSASSRADGCCVKGKTKGKMV
jgi:hypothetical protein